MANIIQKAINFFKKPHVEHITLDPQSVKKEVAINALATENAELKGRLMKIEAEEAQRRESESDEQDEEQVKIALAEREKELRNQDETKYLSLARFFNLYFGNQKFRENLKILSWDRQKTLSNFIDLGISTTGELLIIGKNNEIVMSGRNLKDIFQSVSALETDLLSGGFMVINKNENGEFVPNIQMTTLSELIPDGEGKFYYSPAKKKPLYDYVTELNSDISELENENVALEEANIKLQNDNDELKRANRVLKTGYNVKNATLSENEIAFTSMNSLMSSTTKELQQQRLLNFNLEEWKESLENVLEELRERAEREGTRLSDDKAYEKLKNTVTQVQNMILPVVLTAQENMPQKSDKNGGVVTEEE